MEGIKRMKVLNLYAGIGGNRKLWEDVEVTAVELDPQIAAIYQSYFPNDKVIVGDAHQYLLDHYKEFDFIWASPPCPTHSRINKNFGLIRYADMTLYQEIILLNTWFNGKYCVENVRPYYEPLIPAQLCNRHLFWCNFKIQTTSKANPEKQMGVLATKTKNKITKMKRWHKDGTNTCMKSSIPHFGFDISNIKLKTRKDKVLRNCVDPETGLMILNCARNIITKSNQEQLDLFIDTYY